MSSGDGSERCERRRVLWLIKGLGPGGAEHLLVAAARVRDRAAFAQGALQAAKWVHGRRGWFTIRDVLGL